MEESIALNEQSNSSSYQNWGIKHPSPQKPSHYTPPAMHTQYRSKTNTEQRKAHQQPPSNKCNPAYLLGTATC